MKKLFIITLLFSTFALAQEGSASIKLGFFNPNAADPGFIIGYQGATIIDENISLGWSADWFHVNYVDKKVAQDYDEILGGTSNELRAKTNIHELPFQGVFMATFPVAPRVNVYGLGGLGVELLLVNYNNYENPEQDEFKAALAFNWRIGAGVAYVLNRRSEVIGELTYHSAYPSWEYEVTDQVGRKRTYEREINMSGIMLRIGYKFYY